jgi:MSHA pilin protein MshD
MLYNIQHKSQSHSHGGFTLIELVVGMMVIAIAIVMLTSMLFPQADRALGRVGSFGNE